MGRYKNKLFNKLTPKDKEIVKNNFDELNIKHLMKKQYSELSGGEKQRVLIAKALSIEPDILILDEPTSAMDLVSENNILKILENLNQNKKITIIMITHHLLHINANVTNLVFINKENNVFLSGKKEDVFTEEKLTKLYGNEITFKEGLEINIGEKWA
jgi:iron complex transport system ATP-binding protein